MDGVREQKADMVEAQSPVTLGDFSELRRNADAACGDRADDLLTFDNSASCAATDELPPQPLQDSPMITFLMVAKCVMTWSSEPACDADIAAPSLRSFVRQSSWYRC